MRVTCLGSTRFVGPAAIRALRAAGHDVTLVHRGAYALELPDVELRVAERVDPASFQRAIRETRPDALVDFRAMTRAQAEAVVGAVEVPTVVLSSQDVYAQFGRLNGLPAPEPEPLITEDSPLTIPYPFREIAEHSGGPDYDKKHVEDVYRRSGGDVTILRVPAVYGRGDPRRRFGVVLDALDAGETALPRAEGGRLRWTHGHVADIATAVAHTVGSPGVGYRCFNLGEAEAWTMSEWAERIAVAAGYAFSWRELDSLPEEWGLWGAVPNDVVVDTSRFREQIGAGRERTVDERLDDLIAGLRASRDAADASVE